MPQSADNGLYKLMRDAVPKGVGWVTGNQATLFNIAGFFMAAHTRRRDRGHA
jgi:hypothetical protein